MGAIRSSQLDNEHILPHKVETRDKLGSRTREHPRGLSTVLRNPEEGKPQARPNQTKRPSYSRRRMSPQTGQALEILGHAIEYLADEHILYTDSGAVSLGDDPRVQAIQMMMAANRAVYFECPVLPTAMERLRDLWSHALRPKARQIVE